jgi:ribosomal protein S18 acetylase RimI-like enzyme
MHMDYCRERTSKVDAATCRRTVTRVPDMNTASEVVQPHDLTMMSRAMARAFLDDPVFKVLFGDPVPLGRTSRFFALMADVQLHHGFVHHTPGYEAAAIWAPPEEWKMPVATIVRNAPRLLEVFGRRTVVNLGILSQMEKAHPNEAHYYLEFIGTDPAHQGKGKGTELMEPMMDRCDREGVGAYLESSNQANLAFYHRLGFERRPVINLKAGPTLYPMWRDPH